MRLKAVRIFGFKTFADRTEFLLDGGFVAIVGPNGCGKSNIVDAILWGLGEGNARHLRAQSSQDVIFSGSSRRKPLGFAEVSLIFDNEDGQLPIETSEVVLTRRLTRGGDNEYFINKKSCRLKDFHELMADSGLGRAGYAIVGQKEIDQALAASPYERRAWIDEAAGVQRYRGRKTEAMRRLNSAQEHMQRVTDILTELESQREPMREEAEVAAKYRSLMNSLQEIERGLLIEEVVKALDDIKDAEERIAKSSALSREAITGAEEVERDMEVHERTIRQLEHEIEGLRTRIQEVVTRRERAESDARLVDERLKSLDDLEATLNANEDEILERRLQAEKDQLQLIEEERTERENLAHLEELFGGLDKESKELASQLEAVERELSAARRAEGERLKQLAEREHKTTRIKEISREVKGISETIPQLEEGILEQQREFEALAAAPRKAREAIKKTEEELLNLRKEEESDAAGLRKWLAERSVLEGRIRGIESTIHAHEGLSQGSRSVLEAVKARRLHAEYTPVGEAVSAHKEYAMAIEVALGGSVNDLIVRSDQDAKAAIQFLKESRGGRATFQPISLMRPSEPSPELRRVLSENGVLGRASDRVDVPAEFRPVIESLLGRVVLTDTIDTALKLAKTTGWSRMVTLQGEVVHSSGAVSGGHQNKGGYGMVQRKADLEELEVQVEALGRRIKEAEARANNVGRSRQALQMSIQENRKLIQESEKEVQESEKYLRTLEHELEDTKRSLQRLESERERLQQASVEEIPPVNVEEIEAKRDTVLKEFAARSADSGQVESRLREANDRLRQAVARLEVGKTRLENAQAAIEGRKVRLAHIEPERARLSAEQLEHQHRAKKFEEERISLSDDLVVTGAKRNDMLEKMQASSLQAKTLRESVQSITEAAHQAELARARAESKRSNSALRLFEEYNLTEDDAYAQKGMVEVPDDASTVVNRLRREMKAMGDVNLGAVDAYERLTARVDELSVQMKDIQEGIEQVMASIHELDKLTKDKFVGTFTQVQAAFSEMFQRLFGGGEGSITLSDPNNTLETGIDIEVQLPGKKRQRLELLSGGERALCAATFLFALLKIKPSPLVVIDEVDAPMDGRNVERFADVLLEFSNFMQFICITHNPTTIEKAPIWLGVTMSEPGVSTLIPARLPEGKSVKVNHNAQVSTATSV